MEEGTKITLSLLLIFLFVQAMGIYLGTKLIALPEIQPAESGAVGALIFFYIIIVTLILLVIIKYFRSFLIVLEAIAIFFGTEIFFEVLFLGVVEPSIGGAIAVLLALFVVFFRLYERNIVTQNVAILFSIIGVGSLLGASLGVLPAFILLGLLTIYDVIAVFKTKHMVKMAKVIVKHKVAFTFAIPTKKHLFQLGGGDLVMPMVFTISVLREFGTINAICVMFFSMLSLILFFVWLSKKPRRAYPALPSVTVGALFGFLVSLVLIPIMGAVYAI